MIYVFLRLFFWCSGSCWSWLVLFVVFVLVVLVVFWFVLFFVYIVWWLFVLGVGWWSVIVVVGVWWGSVFGCRCSWNRLVLGLLVVVGKSSLVLGKWSVIFWGFWCLVLIVDLWSGSWRIGFLWVVVCVYWVIVFCWVVVLFICFLWKFLVGWWCCGCGKILLLV